MVNIFNFYSVLLVRSSTWALRNTH